MTSTPTKAVNHVPFTVGGDHFVKRLIAILRCRTWNNWPNDLRCKSEGYEEPIRLSSGGKVLLSVHLVAYAPRPRPEVGAPRPLEKAGPIIWRGQLNVGYRLGDAYLKAPEDEIQISMNFEQPYEGELDIQLHMAATEQASQQEVQDVAHSTCYSMLAALNLLLGDFLVPVAPLHLRELGAAGGTFESSVLIAVERRSVVSGEALQSLLSRFVDSRAAMSAEGSRALSVASRRYISAQSETDPIDRFCDLWECCEFATQDVSAKGGVVGRIAEALTAYWNDGTRDRKLKKSDLERELGIRDLYRTRGAIVHEALDSGDALAGKTSLLRGIAEELLRARVGLPPNPSNELAEAIESLRR